MKATWVRANVQYASVLERIAPLEAEEARLLRNLKAAELEVKEGFLILSFHFYRKIFNYREALF